MKKSILLTLGVFGTSLAVANSIPSGNIVGSGTQALMQNVTTSDRDYDGIVNVRFVLGTAFMGGTCTNSKAIENNLTPDKHGIYCGDRYGVGYNADWYLKKGDKICVFVLGWSEYTHFIWQLMDTNDSSISLWGTVDYPQSSYSSNLSYLGNYDTCTKMGKRI